MFMKNFILFLISTLFTLFGYAQEKEEAAGTRLFRKWQTKLNDGTDLKTGIKGKFILFGAINYSLGLTNGRSTQSNLSTVPDASLPLALGYYLDDFQAVGVNWAFSTSTQGGKRTLVQQEVGVFYTPLLVVDRFIFLALIDFNYVVGKTFGSNGTFHSARNPEGRYNGFRARIYPMFGILLPRGWSVIFKFAELSYLFRKYEGGGPELGNVAAGISGHYFGTGLAKSFVGTSKRHKAKSLN